jgi:hypothetical protein
MLNTDLDALSQELDRFELKAYSLRYLLLIGRIAVVLVWRYPSDMQTCDFRSSA